MYKKQNLDMTRYRGLSTDTKPDADFGSTFHEMDTGDVYRFDGSEWQKCGSLSGTDPSIYMSMWGARGNARRLWGLKALASGHDTGVLKTVTGNPISISDAIATRAKALTVDMSPIQDLHGYDSPWPAGGGKNLLDYDIVLPSIGFTAESDGVFYLATASLSLDKTVWENTGAVEGSVSISYSYKYNSATSQGARFKFVYSDGTSTENYAGASESYVSKTFTSNANKTLTKIISSYGAGSVATWIKDIQVEIGTPTAWSPYSNICPITGRDSVTVTRTGKNLISRIFNDGKIPSISTGDLVNANNSCRSDFIKIKKGSPITVSWESESERTIYAFLYDENKQFLRYGNSAMIRKFSVSDVNALYVMIRCDNGKTPPNNFQLELGSTATDYEPYKGQTVTLQLGQTVYGGTLDVTAGTVTVDRAMRLLNDPDKWSATTGTINYQYNVSFSDRKIHQNSFEGLISSYMPVVNSSTAKTMRWTSASSYICGIKDADLTLEQIKSDASAGKIAICYELAEPITYHLTPQSLALLKGSNTLWTDGDSITLTYKAQAN